uniref:N-acetyl-gamma-glutamyl-phosphate reductase n=1 Tax=Candidatus Kentrum sp. TUN TaxID=2126343 RepID=A0A451A6Q3_9GAMM|nr:MAG: N-acetyl-gamma-glutamyl-phosphate reductase [Candidatus Kentron sp. TUN]VFK60277.1 MAG: N-acetyl-gamma-glutamyl-phosphate reductase [Candidatus Kentron sp. TUN]VFK61706.1 MAG: N-acetyl-gamma-glutamyl-phosphate reductase [Candidatus Kentron sp. TUN]
MIRVGIVGGTGYTGVELLRLLVGHPDTSLEVITSRAEAGNPVDQVFPNLRGHVDMAFSEPDTQALVGCDVVFFATPNGTAMHHAPALLEAGCRIIDLAADFRLKDPATWEKWYGIPHSCPAFLTEAVYGLPEVNRVAIRTARIVANPGCYPTAIQLGFLPLIEQGLVAPSSLIADAKSGVSGAGRKAALGTSLCEASENLNAYAVPGHRHLPEILQGLAAISHPDHPINLTFVPHLTPMIRGIHATLYGRLVANAGLQETELQQIFETRYQNEPFVDVLPAGSHPTTHSVRGSNYCRIACHLPQSAETIVVLSVIDNLGKGAAGQAIQNMNIMFNLDEKTGLNLPGLLP